MSFFQMMVRQEGHLVHSPSVRTLRSSGGTGFSMDFFVRLNQVIYSSGVKTPGLSIYSGRSCPPIILRAKSSDPLKTLRPYPHLRP